MEPARDGAVMECWVPGFVERSSFNDWAEYDEFLYETFRKDFVLSHPVFRGVRVNVRANPRFEEREESYWHLTCRDYAHVSGLPESREPDLERCRRIKWPRAFIDRYLECNPPSSPCECGGVMVWESSHKPRKGRPKRRIKLFLEEESYLMVLEERERYYLLITAYYLDDDESLKRTVREMRRKGAKNAGSAG